MVTAYGCESRDELRRLLAANRVIGLHRQALKNFGRPTPVWKEEVEGTIVDTLPDRTVIDCSPEDQVVVVGAGMRISELQAQLSQHKVTLPLGPGIADWTLADALALNLPHGLEAQHGSWRDWVLGMTVMLANGDVAGLGSRAVKSVAGYDAHKLFIGARGVLGIILEVILRVYPSASVQPSQWRATRKEGFYPTLPGGGWIQRTLPADFGRAVDHATDHLVAVDPASATLWATLRADQELPRHPHDWVLRSNAGAANVEIKDPIVRRLMIRAKEEFDPENKLNPGEFGF